MDSPPANDKASTQKGAPKPSIDSLRTVEFRTTIRGYHMDDVDEYLERVAVEAEELQEQVRLSSDRIKQAVDRAASLEQQIEQLRRAQQSQAAALAAAPAAQVERAEAATPAVADDSLQRTLLLAQKFVDQTRAEAESEARALVAEAETRSRSIVSDAEDHVRVMTEEAERNLRDEVKRLDAQRTELVGDVETIARHLEVERSRIRTALTEMLAWVDEHVQPPKSAGSSSGGSSSDSTKPASPPSRDRFGRGDLAEPAQLLNGPGDKSTKPGGDRNGGYGDQGVSSGGMLAGRTGSDDPNLLGGPPTELIPSPSTGGTDSVEDSSGSTARSSQMASEKPASTHQRQMFAPGRGGTHHTESGVR